MEVETSDGGQWVESTHIHIDTYLALNKLTIKQRVVCRLVLMGYRQCEIARRLGISQSKVSGRFTRAIIFIKNGIK